MVANYVGDASFAFTGSLAAGLAGMDLLGCNLVGFITALGGGTIRDVILGRTPIFWTTHYDEAILCMCISTGAFFGLPYLARSYGITAEGEFVFWTDTVGLAAFAVLGARIAACLPDHHVHAGACALCGLSTACFGGLVRDILCQKPPRILYAEHEMYATPALSGALVCVWLLRSGSERPLDVEGMLLGAWVVIELRVLALNHGARLPAFPSEAVKQRAESLSDLDTAQGLLPEPHAIACPRGSLDGGGRQISPESLVPDLAVTDVKTRSVAMMQNILQQQPAAQSLVVLAHPDHLRRAIRTLQTFLGSKARTFPAWAVAPAMAPYSLDWPSNRSCGSALDLYAGVSAMVHSQGSEFLTSWRARNLGYFPDGDPQIWVRNREVWVLYDHWAMAKGEGDEHIAATFRNPLDHVYSLYLECSYTSFGRDMTLETDFPRDPEENLTSGYMPALSRWLEHFISEDSEEYYNCLAADGQIDKTIAKLHKIFAGFTPKEEIFLGHVTIRRIQK
ncbi:yadS, partial [Symbiodinium sp. KB8]